MSFTITASFVEQFSSAVHFLSSQRASRFSDAVRVESGVVGKTVHFERMDHSDPVPKSRHGDTYIANDTHDRKTATLADYQKGLLIDSLDKVKLLIDPNNTYTKNISYAFARLKDSVIYEAIRKPYVDNSAAVGKVITEDNTNGLNFVKVLDAKTFFDQHEVPEDMRYFGYTAETIKTLLKDANLTSADYNVVKVLVEGKIPEGMKWMGFTWRRFNSAHVARSANNTANHHLLAAWAQDQVGLGIGAEVSISIDKRPDKQNAYQVYGEMSLGGVAIEPEHMVYVEAYSG
jgi:hypothetical protein